MTEPEHFIIAEFDSAGELGPVAPVEALELSSEAISFFEGKLRYLSGDLELPLEGKVPGEFNHLDFRIGSDLNGACVFYFFHDEVIFGSLMLRGINDEKESELAQLFRFRLLESDDIDEPTSEQVESILSSPAFDLTQIEQRPVVFCVQFSQRMDEAAECEHIRAMNQNLAAAFFQLQPK